MLLWRSLRQVHTKDGQVKKKRRREKEKAEREKKNGVFINLKKQLDIVLNCCKEK